MEKLYSISVSKKREYKNKDLREWIFPNMSILEWKICIHKIIRLRDMRYKNKKVQIFIIHLI